MATVAKKFAEIRNSLIWTLIALISFASYVVIPYWEGLSNSWWSLPPMLPADLLPFLLLFVAGLVLLRHWARALYFKRHVLAVTGMFFVSLLLFGLGFAVRPAALFQRGFSQYAKRVLTADEWRAISRLAQEQIQPGGSLPGPHKTLWEETEHRALWSRFTATTQIQKLDPTLVIWVSPESTNIEWGGALTGHRSVTVFTHKGGQLPDATFIAEDIATWVTAD
jgi:hypothetical protein